MPDSLALSKDQLLLAAVCQDTLHIYSVAELGGGTGACPVLPLCSRALPAHLPGLIVSFAWCPAPQRVATYLMLTDSNVLLVASLADPEPRTIAERVEAACWAPDATSLAYVQDGSTLYFAGLDGSVSVHSVAITHDSGEGSTSS